VTVTDVSGTNTDVSGTNTGAAGIAVCFFGRVSRIGPVEGSMRERTKGRHTGEGPRTRPRSAVDLTRRREDGLMDEPPGLQLVGGKPDAEAAQLHPEVAEFVRWFTSWWLTRGLEIITEEEAVQRRAA
jgi:hypothetical protein